VCLFTSCAEPDHFGPARIVIVIEIYICIYTDCDFYYAMPVLTQYGVTRIVVDIAKKKLKVLFCRVD
jgi:hypothetical protein